jgi:hypothetical protein
LDRNSSSFHYEDDKIKVRKSKISKQSVTGCEDVPAYSSSYHQPPQQQALWGNAQRYTRRRESCSV